MGLIGYMQIEIWLCFQFDECMVLSCRLVFGFQQSNLIGSNSWFGSGGEMLIFEEMSLKFDSFRTILLGFEAFR